MTDNTNNDIMDFDGKDFEATQKLLSDTSKINSINKEIEKAKTQKSEVVNDAIDDDDAEDVIQMHLDKFETIEELEKYLDGDVKVPEVAAKVNEFFTNDDTGLVLELKKNPNAKTELDELEFKRAMLLYFKQNDYYTKKMDEEIEKMNIEMEEANRELKEALNPLKDNILAYAEYLKSKSEILDSDDVKTVKVKKANAEKADAIKYGYTLQNMIDLIEKNPSIIDNALNDFRKDTKVMEIGERYGRKINSQKIGFNLFSLLSDDIHDSLEYHVLPQGDYPEGLEGFTVFFIIRSMAMGLTTNKDKIFHASVNISLTRLMEGSLDPEVAETLTDAIKRFLSYFNK